MDIHIKNQVEKTPKEILREANEMWAKFKKAGFGQDGTADEEMVKSIQTSHREFCTSYPVVLRYMTTGEYRHKVMEKFINYVTKHPWTNTEEYLDTQTRYVVMLYKELNPKYDTTKVNNLRQNIRAMLQNEHEEAMELIKAKAEEVEAIERRLNEKSREELSQFYAKYKDETMSVPIRCAVDETLLSAQVPEVAISSDNSAVAVPASSLLD